MNNTPIHTPEFRLRRFWNWFPLGLCYAFFYMGRYNLTVAKNALNELMSKADFGDIFALGAVVYGASGFINGPLTDRRGGRRVMLIAACGTVLANLAMGIVLYGVIEYQWTISIRSWFLWLYAINMYFQNFGAMAIVTVKAPWFHVSERGTFSTIFGVMISLGIYFAFDWGGKIVEGFPGQTYYVFFAPAAIIAFLWLILLFTLRNTPQEAGYRNFPTGENSLDDGGKRRSAFWVTRKIFAHPVLLAVIAIEFCSGIMRNGVMHWYPIFAKETGIPKTFLLREHWGLTLLVAGILGGVLTGWCSDRFFQSRRAPMSGILYGVMFFAAVIMLAGLDSLDPFWVGLGVVAISMAVIGVHGIMSGTATMDFVGSKNTGTAVGIVDGFVYFGTAVQAFLIGHMLPVGNAQKNSGNWDALPVILIPAALIGLIVSLLIWNAKPQAKEQPAVHGTLDGRTDGGRYRS